MRLGVLTLSLLALAGCSKTSATGSPDASLASPGDAGPPSGHQVVNPIDGITSDHVRQAILGDKALAPDAGAIRVATQDGAVTLRGFARSEALKQRAAVVAKAVGGVARVENQLVVDAEAVKAAPPMESALDRAISERVRQALREDRTTAAGCGTVSVLTQDGGREPHGQGRQRGRQGALRPRRERRGEREARREPPRGE
jgi:osmotically-inducible protein OsmY